MAEAADSLCAPRASSSLIGIVMAGASSASVLLANGERFDRVEALDGDREVDLAIVKVPGYGLPALKLAADVPAVGAKVVTLGSPHGLARTVTEGIVSARRLVGGRELVQISASISPGSSGGPVFDAQGRVFAVATSQISDGQQLNFAMPVRYAIGLIPTTVTPRPLVTVFATEGKSSGRPTASRTPTPERGTATIAEFLATPIGVRPSPAARPRTSLTGSYALRYEIRWPDLRREGLDTFQVSSIGLAVVAADHSGFVLRSALDSKDAAGVGRGAPHQRRGRRQGCLPPERIRFRGLPNRGWILRRSNGGR